MLVVSTISGLSSLSSDYKFSSVITEEEKEFYLFETLSASNIGPSISCNYWGDGEDDCSYTLRGSSFVVECSSLEDCFIEINRIIDIQKQIFVLIPNAQFFGPNTAEESYDFAFQFKHEFGDDVIHPIVTVSSEGYFNWYFRYNGERQDGVSVSLPLLIYAIEMEVYSLNN